MKHPVPAQNRCQYCGEYYTPYIRTASVQKSCGKVACRKKHKREIHKLWISRNPNCYRGWYGKVKKWLAAHPGYLKRYRAAHPEYVHKDNAGHRRRKQKMKRFRADIRDGLLRRRIMKIQTLKGADIQETLNLKVDGIIGIMGG